MTYQQITRYNHGRPISEDEMMAYAPSIFATNAPVKSAATTRTSS